jgi:hypothetical protein
VGRLDGESTRKQNIRKIRREEWDVLSQTGVAIMNDQVCIDVLGGHFVYATASGIPGLLIIISPRREEKTVTPISRIRKDE